MIRSATPADAAALAEIYNHYVANTTVTFEEAAVAVDEMAARIREITAVLPWLVSVDQAGIAGYAYANKWRVRAAYRHSTEATVYIRHGWERRGHGRALYRALIDDLRGRGMHCVIGGVALPNASSVALHEALGFRKVAHFREVGRKFEQWIDVAYWELIL